jgi:hypothetical protein
MERIFLGIFYVVSGSFLWISGRASIGALYRESTGKAVYGYADRRFEK